MRSSSAVSAGTSELSGFVQRFLFAASPLAAGVMLDVLDAATFGPVGIVCGAIVGGWAGWQLAKHEGLPANLQFAAAICAAAYMTIPFTELIPAATMLVFLVRFFGGPGSSDGPANARTSEAGGP